MEFLLNIFKNFVPFIFPSEDTSDHVTDPTNLEELSDTAPENSDPSSDNEELILTKPVLASLSAMGFSRSDFLGVFGTVGALIWKALLLQILLNHFFFVFPGEYQ